jgi:hypothetical protein
MSASNSFETAVLTLYFNNTAHANVGDAVGVRGSTTAGSFYISLHTADPGEAGTAVTSEATYTNYARVAVARSAAGFTISGNSVSNAALISFPACGVTGNTITHFGIVETSSGAGALHFSGTASLSVSSGITPQFAIGALTATAD